MFRRSAPFAGTKAIIGAAVTDAAANAAMVSGVPGKETPDGVLRRLEWHVMRRLDGRLQGDYRTLLHGSGVDVAELREYEPGDDVRHIDWNVTARMDTPYVRTYLEDRELTAWLLLDRSASMAFGPTLRTKQTVLTELAATLARLLTRNGNLVAAMLYNNGVERTLPPATGRNHVLRLTHELLRPIAASGTATNLADLVVHATRTIKRRSLVVVISDFITDSNWERPMLLLAQRHDVVAIQLSDPAELDLPNAGLIVVEDAETGELISVDTGDQEFRRRFAEVAQQRSAEIRAAALRARLDLHPVSTRDDLVTALVRIVESRRRRRR
jgi:uncharacterized protein (DUF58 family)